MRTARMGKGGGDGAIADCTIGWQRSCDIAAHTIYQPPTDCLRVAETIQCAGANTMKQRLALVKSSSMPARSGAKGLLAEVREMILATRQTVAQGVNSALVVLYWRIGQRIRTDILKEKRAGYGEKIVHALGAQLSAEFGRGFTKRNLFNMVRFAEVFVDLEIVHALSAQLSWPPLRRIFPLEEPLKRDFYAEMCR